MARFLFFSSILLFSWSFSAPVSSGQNLGSKEKLPLSHPDFIWQRIWNKHLIVENDKIRVFHRILESKKAIKFKFTGNLHYKSGKNWQKKQFLKSEELKLSLLSRRNPLRKRKVKAEKVPADEDWDFCRGPAFISKDSLSLRTCFKENPFGKLRVSKLTEYPSAKLKVNTAKNKNFSFIDYAILEGKVSARRKIAEGFPYEKSFEQIFEGKFILGFGPVKRVFLIWLADVEDAVVATLAGEMPIKADIKALEANAVVIRTRMLSTISSSHRSKAWHFCSDQHCQVINPYKGARLKKFHKAAEATKGEIIVDTDSKPFEIFFSASNGGISADPKAIFNSRKTRKIIYEEGKKVSCKKLGSFLMRKRNRLKKLDPYASWTKKLDVSFLRTSFRLEVGNLKLLRIKKRSASCRAIELEAVGSKGTYLVRGELNIRRKLGFLYSSLFIFGSGNANQLKLPASGKISLIGAGFGHGVGLSQLGSIYHAKAGKTYREIIDHYFPNSRLVNLSGK